MKNNYPLTLLKTKPSPILGSKFKTTPLLLSTVNAPFNKIKYNFEDQKKYNADLYATLKKSKHDWAVGGYLENRYHMLKDSEHMVQEKRFYHLGVDVLVPKGTQIYAPYDGKVVNSEYEDGKGNYGNFCTLEYNVNGTKFYSLFGHLSAKSLPKLKSLIKKGGKLAQIGDYNENGDWFQHLHLQVFTESGYKTFLHKGYCTEEQLVTIDDHCPNPLFLVTY